jgi:glycerol-3-phosphate acyltransferase PlsY
MGVEMDAIALVAILVGYLLGSISFARLMTRWLAPEADVEELEVPIAGTGESSKVEVVGANAASMILGARLGCATALLDMAKVALPVWAFRITYPDQLYFLLVALAGLVGHNWPLYFRFKGGRGFSVIYGSFIVIDWLGALITPLLGSFLGMVILGDVSVAYAAWLWLMIPWMWLRTHDVRYLTFALATNLIFFTATIPEIRTVMKHRREGTYDAYMQGLVESSPRWRGMKKMAERLSIRNWLRRSREVDRPEAQGGDPGQT